jgi:hypothetical protein
VKCLACPTCGREPSTDITSGYPTVACDNCYDADCVGDPPRFVSTAPIGSGMTLAEAIENWNQSVEEHS